VELARRIDRLGGDVDAWTDHELMGVTVQTTSDALRDALELLVDAVTRPTFDPADVDLERKVAIAELELARDDPTDQVGQAMLEAAWGDHPLARPVIGTKETLLRLNPDLLRRHHRRVLRPGGLMVTVAGAVDPRDVSQKVECLVERPDIEPLALPALRWQGKSVQITRPGVEQVHVRLAFRAMSSHDPRTTELAVLSRVLGVGASSRLFQRLREREGLTYDIWSGLLLRSPGGLLEIGWAAAPEVHADVHRLVIEEIGQLPSTLMAEELEVAREGLLRGLRMDAETSGGMCSLEAAEVLERGRRFDLQTVAAEIEKVDLETVRTLAGEILRPAAMASATYGPEGLVEQVA